MESLNWTRPATKNRAGRTRHLLPMSRLPKYVQDLLYPFMGGLLVNLTISLISGVSWGSALIWQSASIGNLTMLLFVVNGLISDKVNISWLEFPLRRLFVSLFFTIIGTLVVAAFNVALFTVIIEGRLPQKLFAGGAGYYWSVLVITLLISLFMHGRSFLLSYREAIVEQEELKRAHLASRFESLQNQVNPHFLFNSLNVLSNLVYKDADLSAQFIQQLSQVYRYVLESQDKEVVTLKEELTILDAYLFLLNIRFGDQMQVDIEMHTDANDQIAPLSLQMLVENAVKHNVVSKRYPLQLRIHRQGDRVVVWNSRKPKQQEQESLGIGLDNIRERYRFLTQEEIIIESSEEEFSVSLPIIQL